MSLLPQIGNLSFERPTATSPDVPSSVEEEHTRELNLLLTQTEMDLKHCQDDIVARSVGYTQHITVHHLCLVHQTLQTLPF